MHFLENDDLLSIFMKLQGRHEIEFNRSVFSCFMRYLVICMVCLFVGDTHTQREKERKREREREGERERDRES